MHGQINVDCALHRYAEITIRIRRSYYSQLWKRLFHITGKPVSHNEKDNIT